MVRRTPLSNIAVMRWRPLSGRRRRSRVGRMAVYPASSLPRASFSRGQVLVFCQLCRPAPERQACQAFPAGLARDPDGGRAHLVPVDAVVVAAVPSCAAGDHLPGQAPPPRRRGPEAAAVHAPGAGQQDRPGHPPVRLGRARPRLVSLAAVPAGRHASEGGHVRVGHRARLRRGQLVLAACL
jgi:hypothetical protein